MFVSLDAIMLFVSDVPACARFYCEAFGFILEPSQHPIEEWAVVSTGSSRILFHRARTPDGPVTEPTGGPYNPHKLCFAVDDLVAVRQRAILHGASMSEISTIAGQNVCDGTDPERHNFRLSQDPRLLA